jgi:hypothetical protein
MGTSTSEQATDPTRCAVCRPSHLRYVHTHRHRNRMHVHVERKLCPQLRASTVQNTDTNAPHSTQTAGRTLANRTSAAEAGLWTVTHFQQAVCPCRRRVVVGSHPPSVRCTDRNLPTCASRVDCRRYYDPLARSLLLRPHTNCEPTGFLWAEGIPAGCSEKGECNRN